LVVAIGIHVGMPTTDRHPEGLMRRGEWLDVSGGALSCEREKKDRSGVGLIIIILPSYHTGSRQALYNLPLHVRLLVCIPNLFVMIKLPIYTYILLTI
jgi:hypothetical protein